MTYRSRVIQTVRLMLPKRFGSRVPVFVGWAPDASLGHAQNLVTHRAMKDLSR